jgi:hypothetical protein
MTNYITITKNTIQLDNTQTAQKQYKQHEKNKNDNKN